MAKMFYTMEETKAALGRNEDEIRQLAREGRLREFRDGPRLMFKADQVEQLKADLGGGGDALNLGSSDSGAPLGLVDTKGGSGSGISLVDTHSGKAVANPKEETAFADIGLSGTIGGSIGGVPSPGRGSPSSGSGIGLSGTGVSGSGVPAGHGSRGGITLDIDDHHRADPSAQTAVGSGLVDQVNLEGVGSGSGLLDLTRESDDTSLGAVFDELTPSPSAGRGRVAPGGSSIGGVGGSGTGIAVDSGGSGTAAGYRVGPIRGGGVITPSPVTMVEKADATALAFGLMALGGTVVLAFGLFVLAAVISGVKLGVLAEMRSGTNGMMYFLAALVGIIVLGVVGFIGGRLTTR